jgi:excisionase family DNA binding protein
MTTRGHIGARTGSGGNAADDDLTRLVRLIARQAAQEAFAVFKDALETSIAQAKAASDAHAQEAAAEVRADKALQSPESGERFLSVAEVAVRLDVSEKTVRRMIDREELAAIRVGSQLRIDLAAYVARAHRKERIRK